MIVDLRKEAEMELVTDPLQSLKASVAGRYEIDREIGQGAFATVYLARDLRHDRQVAFKVLNPDPISETGSLRFIREIRLLARLQHPNILGLIDSGRVQMMLYYVMPYVSGDSLAGRLRKERRIPVDDAVTITRELADALGYAHRENVIHRDIKPDNILFSAGHPILADFGVARAISTAGVQRITRTGVSIPGTPAYMSPEQLMGGRELDARSDIYSLGCVLYEMLTGKPPFQGKDGFVRRFTEPAPKVSTIAPELASALDDVLARALARDPRDRYGTAEEFRRELASH